MTLGFFFARAVVWSAAERGGSGPSRDSPAAAWRARPAVRLRVKSPSGENHPAPKKPVGGGVASPRRARFYREFRERWRSGARVVVARPAGVRRRLEVSVPEGDIQAKAPACERPGRLAAGFRVPDG